MFHLKFRLCMFLFENLVCPLTIRWNLLVFDIFVQILVYIYSIQAMFYCIFHALKMSKKWVFNCKWWYNYFFFTLKTNFSTVKSRYTGPKSNGNPPITDAKLWSLQTLLFIAYIGNNKKPPITDEIGWSLDIHYSEV